MLIHLGRHQLWCGDAKDAPFPKADMVLTDPPFEMSANEVAQVIKKFSEIFVVAGHGKNYHHLCAAFRYHFEIVSVRSKPQSTPQRKSPQILHWNNAFLTTGCEHCFDRDLVGTYFPSVMECKSLQSGYAKPLEWALNILRACHAATVVDCFAGTGTTLIACEKLGKTCYAAEKDNRLCQLIQERFLAS
ncbi:MAG: site-specific DNA-methyltransferase [Desmonostoc geniculatum HA4340-LM1]|jgi:DNA modification methylase|nr:site-specific DNA-methyltransferase [Desmonostoc geniculatum HA4340-LM1]